MLVLVKTHVFTLGGRDDASSRHRGTIFASSPSCTRLHRSRCYQLLRWIGLGVAPPNLIPNAWFSLYLASHHLSAQRIRALSFVFVVAASRPVPQLSCLTYQIQALATCLPAQLWQLAADHAMDPLAICEHGTKEARVCVDSDGVASNSVQDAPAQKDCPHLNSRKYGRERCTNYYELGSGERGMAQLAAEQT